MYESMDLDDMHPAEMLAKIGELFDSLLESNSHNLTFEVSKNPESDIWGYDGTQVFTLHLRKEKMYSVNPHYSISIVMDREFSIPGQPDAPILSSEWSCDPPTEPGNYFFSCGETKDHGVKMARVEYGNPNSDDIVALAMNIPGDNRYHPIIEGALWYRIPEPPKMIYPAAFNSPEQNANQKEQQ